MVATGCQTIDAFLREASHLANDNIFLKMDIGGAEYEVIPSMTRDTLAHFDQIALELHWLTRLNEDELYHRLMSMFELLLPTHQVIHVHANNYGWLDLLGGVPIPDTFELTFLRKRNRAFKSAESVYPTALDFLCNPDLPDYYLGKLGL